MCSRKHQIISSGFPRVPNFLCRAATSGVVPPDIIKPEYEAMSVSDDVVNLAAKLGDFNLDLKIVPARSEQGYTAVVEENNKTIWGYAKSEAIKLIADSTMPQFRGDADKLFDNTKYVKKGQVANYTNALTNAKAVFARGAWKYFWAAVSTKVQAKRDLTQRVAADLGVTQAEFDANLKNLTYIGLGYAYSAKTTQSKSYILQTSLLQKKEDNNEFARWLRSKASGLTRILRMNISDIPFQYCPDEIQAFEMDPQDEAKRKALEAKLLQLQKDAVIEWRKDKGAFDYDTWISTK